MATSYTTLLGLALPVQGELQGTWGDEVNNYITNYLDAAVAGTQTLSTDADVTLTKTTGTSLGATSSQYSILRFSGARTAQRTVTVPAASKTYVAINDTTGGFAVKVVGAGPTTGITIAAGEAAVITWNGSDFVKISSNQVTLAGNNAFTGANTFYNATGQTFGTATATNDGLILTGRAGGSSSYRTSITPGTLTASNTLTLPIETTTLAGLGTAQTFSATQTFSGAVTMSATTQNLALGTSQTTGTWTAGGAAQTGTITLDQSTKTHTLSIGGGATESAATKTINIGTGGVATSTTAIAIGSTNGTTTTLNGTVNATGALTVTGAVTANGNVTLGDASADTVTVNGTSTFTAKPTVQLTSAATNTVTQAMRLDSQSSGTPAAGIGVGLEFAAETAAGNTEVGATLEAITTDVTATSEDFDLSVKLMIAGAAATEVARFKPTGLTLATGDTYQINNTDVLSATTLGSGVVTSSLTTVGTIGTGVWQGTVVGSTYGGTGINNAGRTLTINTNSGTIAFSGASTTMTFPAASATLAGLGTTQTFTGINTFTPAARTSGVASYFTLTTPADTGQTASTESIGANFTAATRTWATGALTLQRERVFAAPTYAFAGASTLTTAVNVDIAAPVAGTNATITNAYALRAAASQFTGAVNITGLTASKPVFTDANKNLTSTGTVPVDQGGTGQTTYTNGELLIGNTTGNTLTKATLTAGSGVSITNGAGSITIAATGSGGTVTSVDVSGGTTGLTTSGGPVTGSGTITLAGTLAVANGGTGQTTYTDGQLLIGNTTGNTLTKATLTAGSGISITNGTGSITIAATSSGGDVVGPASSTDNAVVRFDGATGKLVQNSAVTIADTTGDITGGAYNKVTITAPATSATLTIADGKTLTANNSLTLAGTDATTMTFPTTSASIARTDAGQTFTGTQTVLAAATQDAVALAGRAGGTSSYITTITPGTLTASNTLTLPIVTGTLATTASATQTFSGSTTFSNTFTLSGTTQNISLGTSQTTGTWTAGGTAQTGAITLGRSTGAQTVNIATGATATATTKAVNIGTAGLSGSTTNLTYGSAVAGSTTTHVWNSGGTEAARLDSTGLGIGTSSPGAKLDVQTSGSTSALFTNGTTNQWAVKIIQSGSTELQLSPAITGNSGPSIRSVTSGGAAYAPLTLDGSTITLKYGGTTGVLLDSSGNLGIGTSSPNYSLTSYKAGAVANYLQVASGATGAGSGNGLLLGVDASGNSIINAQGAVSLNTYVAGLLRTTIDSSGNLGIGTSSPLQQLHLSSASATGMQITYQGVGAARIGVAAGNLLNFGLDTSNGTTTRMTLDSSGNLGIGTSSPAYKLDVVGPVQSSAGYYINGNASGGYIWVRDNYALRFGTNDTERMRLDSSGNLGLGVTPSAWSGVGGVFEINGNSYIYSTTGVMSLGANAYFNGTNWIYKTTQATTRYEQVNGQHQWSYAASGTAGNAISFTQAMTLDASGNLGVGTTSPTQKLQVNGTAVLFNNTAGTFDLQLYQTNRYDGRITVNSSGFEISQRQALPLLFLTSDTERARIDSSGNLGIGTTNPSAYGLVAVNGASASVNINATTGAAAFKLYEGAGTGRGSVTSLNGANGLAFLYGTTEGMRLDSSGNLGVGTTSIAERLVVNGNASVDVYKLRSNTATPASTDSFIYRPADNTLAFGTASTERARIDSSGNFGVGSTSPSTYGKFVVEGTGAFTSAMVSTSSTLSHKPTLEFRKTVATGSGSTNNVGRISFNAKWDSVQQEIGYLSADMTNASNVLSTTKLRLAGVSYPAVAEDYIEIDQGTATTVESSGNIVLDAAKDMTLQTGGSSYVIKFTLDLAERARITAAGNIKIGGTASRATTEGTNQLVLFNGTAPAGTLTNGVSFYSASGEARVMDAAGNSTLLSPHDQATNEWIFHSKHTPTGKVLRIDVERLLKFVNDHFGLDMVQEFIET